ncbi:hypothetical protein [Cryobacterium roopkundense]|uniref:Uncharacterized protein n=1 Tax=Cryobacterium roopkundense TaxID=1001240 RepID=A0A7W9E4Q2_9MICO|nr:hypothetical protein [Cryobacterium roopkundense]MBB5641679.1 hypothetical protein [Cryobacterium roopkundense]
MLFIDEPTSRFGPGGQVDFAMQVSADGVQIANGTAAKGEGTGEQADYHPAAHPMMGSV